MGASVARGEHPPSLTTLYTFQGPPDGANPGPAVIGQGGEVFGVTLQGGIVQGSEECAGGCGTVFELAPPTTTGGAWTETVLYRFTGTNGDGAQPNGVALASDGSLYGTTAYGGLANCGLGCGTVFRLVPPAEGEGPWSETMIHSFTGQQGDGLEPFAPPVIGADGALWGTTYGGGSASGPDCAGGCGAVFELVPLANGAWQERILYSFTGSNGDGAYPYAGVTIGPGGVLYGTTAYGGTDDLCGGCGSGTVFELKPPSAPGGSWTEEVLYSFKGNMTGAYDGSFPKASPVVAPNWVLYGTTETGGDSLTGGVFGSGTVYELIPPAAEGGTWSEKVIHSFGGTGDGLLPTAPPTLGPSGVLYGATSAGENEFGGFFGPVVYELAPPSRAGQDWRYGPLIENLGSGAAILIGSDGLLYGTGRGFGFGSVFRITP